MSSGCQWRSIFDFDLSMIHVGQPSLTEPHRRFASPFAGCGHILPRPGLKVKQILEEPRDDDRSIHQRAQMIYMVTSPEVNSATAQLNCAAMHATLISFCCCSVFASHASGPGVGAAVQGGPPASISFPRRKVGTGYSTEAFVLHGQLRSGRPRGE